MILLFYLAISYKCVVGSKSHQGTARDSQGETNPDKSVSSLKFVCIFNIASALFVVQNRFRAFNHSLFRRIQIIVYNLGGFDASVE